MFTIASILFLLATAFIFVPLDIKYRRVPNKLLLIVFLICAGCYLFIDFWLAKSVTGIEIIIGIILFFLSYIFFAAAVMFGSIGAADVKIFSVLILFLPVYPDGLILSGIGTLPALDIVCNFMILAVPTLFLFRALQPGRPAPGLVGFLAAAVISCTYGNILLTFLIHFL